MNFSCVLCEGKLNNEYLFVNKFCSCVERLNGIYHFMNIDQLKY